MICIANSCNQVQNITADNVSVNNKSLRVLGKKLKAESHDFNATAQRSQSVFLVKIKLCFTHSDWYYQQLLLARCGYC